MAVLNKIVIQDFRNISLQELSFSDNLNCITGGNGEGKTNLLDAIWYLSMTKSAFTPADSFNVRHGAQGFSIAGSYTLSGDRPCRIAVSVGGKGDKKVRRDDKPYGRISEHIGLLPIVMVSPSDTTMVSDSGDERRRFANSVLSQMDCNYLFNLQQYNRMLLQRNRLLRDGVGDRSLLDVIDIRMSELAAPIHESRRRFTEELLPAVRKYYTRIAGSTEQIGIRYRSQLEEGTLYDILKDRRDSDSALKFTASGIHRDDFIFEMDGYPIRRCGSQGQQKSFLVALKFAQYDIMKRKYGYPPILLLDDLFDKLDLDRVSNLLKMVSGEEFGQIFLSDANRDRTRSVVEGLGTDRSYFEARGGAFWNE